MKFIAALLSFKQNVMVVWYVLHFVSGLQINDYDTTTILRPPELCPGLSRWAGTRKVKNQSGFTGARDSEWQWHQLGYMQICTLPQTDNHASIPSLSF